MKTPRRAAEPKAPADPSTDLARRVRDPGFTPSVKRIRDLFDLIGHDDEDLAKNAERAILRIESQYAADVAKACVERARAAERPGRGRLTALAGRLAQERRDPDGAARGWLFEALEDADPKTRRAAARGLGKLPPKADAEEALGRAYDAASSDDDRRVFALALGKMGGEAARARLAGTTHGRARVIVDRELARKTPGTIDPTRSLARSVPIHFHTRSGLEDVLREELGRQFGIPRFVAPGIVKAELTGALSEALRIRTALSVGFPLPPIDASDDLATDVVRALGEASALDLLRAFTSVTGGAPIRFRLEFTRGGHRRSTVWRIAELVRAQIPELVNDPKTSTWEVAVDDAAGKVKIELVPRAFADDRFVYREALVAASSHPAIAAALARVAPRSDDDVVWDPFVGAGAELVERARLGKYARLVGTDIDPRAVSAARANLERAGLAEHAS
ncbi:MAG TPA: HEAT repeat domain-containing protein, partial [Labilithrix sp.]|nr:HEAT repeat domain-containing protein [Labilithrix sp.]